ncbi:hypothetical protein [Nocardioides coralli]|uniref:hypothetical protein n=1 Tax=Nocardioides coralli TaxID=2872154 RepID=UPI001CA3FF69|nr:hypothetical protein [Nocardioides coralli]QZY30515.1 hypothetical protein K6T13_07680 [Nocardioides coralli]
MPRTPVRPVRVRVLSTVVEALTGALVAAAALVALPAHAQLAIPVQCSNGKTVLEWDDTTYDLDGTCGVVVVAADRTTVSMPAATRLVVRGEDNDVDAKTLTELVVAGHDNRVASPSVRRLRLASPGSVADVEGLVERAELRRSRGTLRARQVSELLVRGSGHDVRARRGYLTRVPGDRSELAFGRLEDLRVAGDRNTIRVRRGATEVSVGGSANRVRVRRRG